MPILNKNLQNLQKQLNQIQAQEKLKRTFNKTLKAAKERGFQNGFSRLTDEERNIWQRIYNEAGPDAFKQIGINIQFDPSTRYSNKKRVSSIQNRNARNKYLGYVSSLEYNLSKKLEENDEELINLRMNPRGSLASDPGRLSPSPQPPLFTFQNPLNSYNSSEVIKPKAKPSQWEKLKKFIGRGRRTRKHKSRRSTKRRGSTRKH